MSKPDFPSLLRDLSIVSNSTSFGSEYYENVTASGI